MPKPTGPQFEAFLDPSHAWGSDYAGQYSAQISIRNVGDDNPLTGMFHGSYITWDGPGAGARWRPGTSDLGGTYDLGTHKTAASIVRAVAKKAGVKIAPSFKEEDVRPMADMIQRVGPDEFKAATNAITSMTGGKDQ